ncbi:YbhB/YbcL family Raf kinase inhibitor-like protein [Methylobacterium sp. J-076]|uniref:YbhB/YbcL family Raf kinase inhibitor-like protein n=1 Tax=Methylobacterium sp. J-076 TaxID=2836655 RepID=UPI001FB9F469|nr:YbhB/YbcL family Raf kinase inhibitor-like protein [Methylobacterium sp. J-076]MCJ2015026.1 YbhB/YbcL family Raf kinase inhibitor-like protein [Methylobacterium sp. J-076]
MLEKMPRVLGEALSGVKAGLDGTTFHAAFPDAPPEVRVSSDAFADRAAIPPRFTADGEGTSPPLAWDGLPPGTAALAVIVEDAGSPTPRPLVHLLAWNIDPAGRLAEGAAAGEAAAGPTLGKNSFMKAGWLPPDPPTGHGDHQYLFQVYALSRRLDLDAGSGREALVEAMQGHVLAKGSLTGTYARA